MPEPPETAAAHRWEVLGAKTLYESPWVSLDLATVRPGGGEPFDHHVVRVPPAAGLLVHDPARGVLLIWRHRFAVGSEGWEIPAGKLEPGEAADEAARRECEEETGWRPGPARPLCRFAPVPGIMDHWFHAHLADRAEQIGDPDPLEAGAVAWHPVADLAELIARGAMPDGPSLLAVSFALAVGALD